MVNWSNDINQMLQYQRNILMFLSFGLMTLILFLLFALFSAYSGKKFQPFVIDISDNGFIRVLEPIYENTLSNQERIDKYFIAKFIKAVELEGTTDVKQREITINALADQNIAKKLISKDKSFANEIIIKSFLLTDKNAYYVSFSLINGTNTQNKTALIEYGYEEKNISTDALLINPVGFVVTNYKVENDK